MPIRHLVKKGDCVASVAFEHGFHPDDVWDDPENAALAQQRQNGHVLKPGDVLVVQDLRLRLEQVATGRTHVFRRLAVPERLNVALLDAEGKPRAGVEYTLEIRGRAPQSGTTDGAGKLVGWIPPAATAGVLKVKNEPPRKLALGYLAPIDTEEGVRARLANLGHLRREGGDEQALFEAIVRFQQASHLTPTGAVDADVRRALQEAHGS